MTATPVLCCADDSGRRRAARAADVNGIDSVDVDTYAGDVSLRVTFIGRAPDGLDGDAPSLGFVLEGGRRIRDLRLGPPHVTRAGHPDDDDVVHIPIDREGDHTVYRLCVMALDERGHPLPGDPAGFDPRYTSAPVRFRIDCVTGHDCAESDADDACCGGASDSVAPTPVELDYLAKDYQSFRRLILDRFAVTLPDWRDREVPDIWITLAEVLAYAADHLSYQQDAVATEGYLRTARRRVSVRRHLRLLDYHLHQGNNARAWVVAQVSAPIAVADLAFTTAPASGARPVALPPSEVTSEVVYFAPVGSGLPPDTLRPELNRLEFFTWGGTECYLPVGATAASFVHPGGGDRPLAPGDRLLIEEVAGPVTGDPADADPAHRHVVRVETAEPEADPVSGTRLLAVTWCAGDALPFTLHLAAVTTRACAHQEGLAVAWGNVVLVDHGRPGDEDLYAPASFPPDEGCPSGCCAEPAAPGPRPYRPELDVTDLTHCEPVTDGCPSTDLLRQDPHRGLAAVVVTQIVDGVADEWHAVPDLLRSGPHDRDMVVEIDDDDRATLRFGDGTAGLPPVPHDRLPPASSPHIRAAYRVGNGDAGNVSAESIVQAVHVAEGSLNATITVRNPLPAAGGTPAQPVDVARRLGPFSVGHDLARAVVPADYAQAVMTRFASRVQRAVATRRSTGTTTEIQVAIDPLGSTELSEELRGEIDRYLATIRRINHVVRVVGADQVGIVVDLSVCLAPGAVSDEVARRLADLLGAGVTADGRRGLFHPDERSFGAPVYRSSLVQAVLGDPDVTSIVDLMLARVYDPLTHADVLSLGPTEIARLDNDRNDPSTGYLTLTLAGGR
jgi:hypothetical protein